MRRVRSVFVSALVLAACARHGAAGNDASVSGTWTVEGAAPTEASCAEVGIDTVRLGIYGAGGEEYIDRLEAPCIAGRLDTVTPVLAAGTYDVAWEGFRAGVRVAQGDRHSLVAAAGGHAVVPVVDFVSGYDPSGTDATLSARWTIDGVPPTGAACLALGVTRVRVAAFHGTRAIELAPLTATCATGVIDTRPLPALAAGDVVLQLQALDAHQVVLFSGAMVMLHVPSGPAHVALYDDVPVDFTAGTFDPRGSDSGVSFRWTLDHQTPSIDVCDSVNAATAQLVLYAHDDTGHAHGVPVAQAPCHLGALDTGATGAIRAGTYLASVEALDAAGNVIASASPSSTPFAVAAGTPLDVPTVDLAFPTTLTITLDWQDPVMGGAATCATAGVLTTSYMLVDTATGTAIAHADGPCLERISFDVATTPALVTGTYDLAVSGGNASRTWHTSSPECRGLTVVDGTIQWDACFVTTP